MKKMNPPMSSTGSSAVDKERRAGRGGAGRLFASGNALFAQWRICQLRELESLVSEPRPGGRVHHAADGIG
jgi:hypothetical protein